MRALTILACVAAVAVPMAAAAQPSSLRSSDQLAEDGGRDSWSYRNASANLGQYKSFIVEPTVVYADPSAKWGGTTPAQRAAFAEMLTRDLREEMAKHYTLASAPGPGVATMRLTLLSVAATVPGVATATKVTPVGLALNGVKSLAGKPGSFSGSAQVAFELTDSSSNELLAAAVRKRSPDALDISASLSTENTIASVSKDVAEAIRKGLDKATR